MSIQVERLTSSGPLSVPSLQASCLSTEQLDASSLSVPSLPIYQLESSRTESRNNDPPVEVIRRDQGILESGTMESKINDCVEPPPPRIIQEGEDDDILDLGTRLGRSLVRSGIRAINSMMRFFDNLVPVDPDSEQKQRMHLQVMLCVLLLLVTGIFLITKTGTTHHHWDFYLPPTDL